MKTINFRTGSYAILFFLLQHQLVGLSSTTGTQVSLNPEVDLGVYSLDSYECLSADQHTRTKESNLFPLKIVFGEKENYLLKKIDSSCSYKQSFKVHWLGEDNYRMSLGEVSVVGSCYFSPESFLARPMSARNLRLHSVEGLRKETLRLVWENNPSSQLCTASEKLAWTFELRKRFPKKLPDRKLAKLPTPEGFSQIN